MSFPSEVKPALYTVAWITTSETVFYAAQELLTTNHYNSLLLPDPGSKIVYALGNVGMRNIVIVSSHARSPKGRIDEDAMGVMSRQLRALFPNLKASLLVLTGSGVPSKKHDVRLGDVVVSVPEDNGKLKGRWNGVVGVEDADPVDGRVTITPKRLGGVGVGVGVRALVATQAFKDVVGEFCDKSPKHLAKLLKNFPMCEFPRKADDILLTKDSFHALTDGNGPCTKCPMQGSKAIDRASRKDTTVHFGTVATVQKYVIPAIEIRDAICRDTGAAAIVANAASLMRDIDLKPIIVVGIKEYADWHSRTWVGEWERFAGAAAAAVAREIVEKL